MNSQSKNEPIMKSGTPSPGMWPTVIVLLTFLVIAGLAIWFISRMVLGESIFSVLGLGTKATPTPEIQATEDQLIVVDTPPSPDSGVTLTAFAENPSLYQGQEITIVGVTNQRVEPWGFTMVETKDDTQEVLVVLLPESSSINEVTKDSFTKNTSIEVTGTVKLLTQEDEEEFGFQPGDLQLNPWLDQYVIQANEVKKI